MRKILKTAVFVAFAIASSFSVISCSTEVEPKILTAEAIDERINNIGDISLKNEWPIEEIFVDYTNLPESEKLPYKALPHGREMRPEN